MSTSKTLLALTICASVLGAPAATALPGSQSTRPVAAATDTSSIVHEARYRGHGGYRGHYGGYRGHRGGWGRGRAIGLGIAGAIIGSAIIANEGYRYRRYQSVSGRQQCANTYRSFDWDSGTYMGYDGVRRVCPYL